MNRRSFHWPRQMLPLLALAATGHAGAETLLIDRLHGETALQAPTRGMHMREVEARFGAPGQRLDPRGGQKRQWPTIHRWVYPDFTVYFEHDRVIDTVAAKAHPSEDGPRPPIR